MGNVSSMRMNIIMRLLFLCLLVSSVTLQQQLAPALYIFGDSIVDPGNNNNNPHTLAKANFKPYGIDFPAGPTGRFSNGKNLADLIAGLLHLPTPPGISEFDAKRAHTYGFNYASASSGILDESGSRFSGGNLNMRTQVELFEKTVKTYLPKQFNYNGHKLTRHLTKSIYIVLSGSNDYALNYFNTGLYNTSKIYNPVSFADHLLGELVNHILKLYKLGARKFVIFEIAPLGCLPSTVGLMKPKTRCVEDINNAVNVYNVKLSYVLNCTSGVLKGSTFVIAKTYPLFYNMIINPTPYGFSESRIPCCPRNCQINEVPCENRAQYVFWDHSHPSEAASKIAATKCFYEVGGLCTPMSIYKLATKLRN